MKIAITLFVGTLLGLVISHAADPIASHLSSTPGFAGHYSNTENAGFQFHGNDSAPSPTMGLMQTDTALCDQPYFVEVYELSVLFFTENVENTRANDFADVLFGHARTSGHFSEEEAEAWITHIKGIPSQLVEIYREDPTVLDNCYNFQVAAVGPPF